MGLGSLEHSSGPAGAGAGGGKGSAAVLSLAGVYELSGRPNTCKVADLSKGTWDALTCRALVERPKKYLVVMGHWIGGGADGGGQPKKLALFPEETLLLVEQGLLLLRMPETRCILSVAEVQALALSHAQLCPLFFEVYAHIRDLGLIALRLELLEQQQHAQKLDGTSQCGGEEPSTRQFRGRPILALWSATRACQKGWRETSPDFVLFTARSCKLLPSASEWAHMQALAERAGATVKFAVADATGSPVFFDCSGGDAKEEEGREAPKCGHAEEHPVLDVEGVKALIKLQGDKVRQLKAKLTQDKSLEVTLRSEIQALKSLKARLPPDLPAPLPPTKRTKR